MIKNINPAEKDGKYLLCHDSSGRVIEYRKGGTARKIDTHLSRQIKAGDLVVVEDEKAPKQAKKKEEPAKVETFKFNTEE